MSGLDQSANDSPRDPVELGLKNAALFVPTHGMESDGINLSIGGLRFVRLAFWQWDMIEKLWVRDLYGDFYRARPKWYCMFPFEAEPTISPSEIGELTQSFLEAFRRFVLAARLVQPGTLVDAHRTVHVARVGNQNYRTVGLLRFRLYAAAFGQRLVLPAKSRSTESRAEYLPPRVIEPIGPAYAVTAQTVVDIEKMLALYESCRNAGADRTIDVVLRKFTLGHDIFLHPRQRFLCLIGALEACFGSFGRPKAEPVLGRRIAQALALFRGHPGDIESQVEVRLRSVRNALAHGGEPRGLFGLPDAHLMVADVLRVSLPFLMKLALKLEKALESRSATDGHSAMHAFQRLLDLAAKDDKDAVRMLVGP